MLSLIILINLLRTTPVVQDPFLTQVAQERAEYLCDHEFSHAGWGDKKYMGNFSYRGENLAKGFKSMEAVNQAFLNSPTHKMVMLKEEFKFVGIGESCGIVVEEFGGYVN